MGPLSVEISFRSLPISTRDTVPKDYYVFMYVRALSDGAITMDKRGTRMQSKYGLKLILRSSRSVSHIGDQDAAHGAMESW